MSSCQQGAVIISVEYREMLALVVVCDMHSRVVCMSVCTVRECSRLCSCCTQHFFDVSGFDISIVPVTIESTSKHPSTPRYPLATAV